MTLPLAAPQEQPMPRQPFFYLRKPCFSLEHGNGFFTFEDCEMSTKCYTIIRARFQDGTVLQGTPDVLAEQGVEDAVGPLLDAPVYPGRLCGHNMPRGFWADEAVAERVLAERMRMVA